MQDRRPRKKWIWWIVVPLALMALGVLLLVLLGSGGASARFDDAESVLSGYDSTGFGAFSMDPEGTVTVRMNREDLYWAASRYGLLEEIRRGIGERCGPSAVGFRLTDGKAMVYLRGRALRFLPLTYRGEVRAELAPRGGALILRTEKVNLGTRIPLPRQFWPALFTEELRIPLGEIGAGVRDVRLEGEALIVELEGLSRVFAGPLAADRDLLTAIRVFLPDVMAQNDTAASLMELEDRQITRSWAQSRVLTAEDPLSAARELLSFCTAASVETLLERTDPLTRDVLSRSLIRAAGERQEERETLLAAEQSRYEKLLTAVREMYKSGSLGIGETGFYNASTGETVDPGSLTKLSVTATDSRIVFLYADGDEPEILPEDMPPATDVPRDKGSRGEPTLDPDRAYDLGVALTTEGGVPALLYRRQDGAFVIREIPETLYVSILVNQSIPVLCAEELPPCAGEILRPAGEGWNGCVIRITIAEGE